MVVVLQKEAFSVRGSRQSETQRGQAGVNGGDRVVSDFWTPAGSTGQDRDMEIALPAARPTTTTTES